MSNMTSVDLLPSAPPPELDPHGLRPHRPELRTAELRLALARAEQKHLQHLSPATISRLCRRPWVCSGQVLTREALLRLASRGRDLGVSTVDVRRTQNLQSRGPHAEFCTAEPCLPAASTSVPTARGERGHAGRVPVGRGCGGVARHCGPPGQHNGVCLKGSGLQLSGYTGVQRWCANTR